MSSFFKLPDRNKRYKNIFIRPDLAYNDRIARNILNIGAATLHNSIKCVFNYRTFKYELRKFNIIDDKHSID